jgi:hypothetical protein
VSWGSWAAAANELWGLLAADGFEQKRYMPLVVLTRPKSKSNPKKIEKALRKMFLNVVGTYLLKA